MLAALSRWRPPASLVRREPLSATAVRRWASSTITQGAVAAATSGGGRRPPEATAAREAGIALWRKHRQAFKSPRRKSNALMEAVRREEYDKFKRDKAEIPDFRAGDAIEVTMLWELGRDKTTSVRGLVLGRTNKGLDSSVLLYCVAQGTPYLRRIPYHAPDIKSVKVVQKAFLHKGKKRVRRGKITYLLKKGYNIRAP